MHVTRRDRRNRRARAGGGIALDARRVGLEPEDAHARVEEVPYVVEVVERDEVSAKHALRRSEKGVGWEVIYLKLRSGDMTNELHAEKAL